MNTIYDRESKSSAFPETNWFIVNRERARKNLVRKHEDVVNRRALTSGSMSNYFYAPSQSSS